MTWGKTESSNESGYEPGVSFPAPGQITQEKLGTQILRQKDCEFEKSQLYIVKLPQKQNRYQRSQLISVHDVRNFSPDGLTSFVMVGMTPKEGIGRSKAVCFMVTWKQGRSGCTCVFQGYALVI